MSLRWSDERAKIAPAFVKAQSEIDGAKKGKVNPHFKSKYADLESVWDACRSALTDNELAIIQSPGEFRDGAVGMDTMLIHSSGEWVCGSMSIPIGSKVDAQGYGSAITYARRYALAAVLGVIQEDDDGNAAVRPAPAAKSAQADAGKVPETTRQQLDAIALIDECDTVHRLKIWVEQYGALFKEGTEQHRTATAAWKAREAKIKSMDKIAA